MEAAPATSPGDAPIALLAVAAQAAARDGAAQAASPPALVRRVEIVGSSLPASTLARLRAGLVERPVDATTGARAVAALQAAYVRADVALAQVGGPAFGADGALTLAVLEGQVEGVDVVGGTSRQRRLAHLYARRLLHEAPLRRSTYERVTALIAMTPGVKAGFGFAVTSRPGVMRLKVELRSARVRIDAQVTDRGPVAFGAWQGRVDARGFSLFRGGDQAVLTLGSAADPHRLRLIGGAYVTPLGADGLTLALSAAHVEGEPYRASLSSRGTSVRAALAYPLSMRWDGTVAAVAALDGQDGQNAAGALTYDDERTRDLRLGLTATHLWGATTAAGGAVVSAGLPVADARPAHPGYAPTSYGKLVAYGGLATPYGPWTVRLHAAAQAAGSRLPSAEQFTLGGDDYGRGFRAVSLQGDEGIAASAELALRLREGLLPRRLGGAEAFAYLDGGAIRVRARPGVRGGDGGLASAGVGVRLGLGSHAGLELSADRDLADHDPLGGPERRGWRLGLRLRLAYAPGAGRWLQQTDLAAYAPFNPVAP